jgi:wyosine [tRNA(Phe)-imidazoG37] synthetase (radical SAM superfamily)
MEEAANLAFALQDKIKLSQGQLIPQIYYPLPQNIGELTRERSAGFFFASLDALRAEALRRHDRATEPDALEYLHGCLNRFADFASILVSRSPLAPKPIVITPEDIIGEVRVR